MGPSPSKTSLFIGTPYSATETSVQPCCITQNAPQPSSLSSPRTFSSQGSPSPPCYPPHFGVIPPLLHEGPRGGRGVELPIACLTIYSPRQQLLHFILITIIPTLLFILCRRNGPASP